MVRRLNGITVLSSLMLLGAIVVIVGCSSKAPLGLSENPGALDRIVPTLPPIAVEMVEASELILSDRPDSIEIVRGSAIHEFIIPEGALNASTVIDIKSTKAVVKDKISIVFEFGPDGLIFNEATILNIDIGDLNARALTANLYYFDPKANDWVFQGTVPVNNGHAEFNIYHFSKYAIN